MGSSGNCSNSSLFGSTTPAIDEKGCFLLQVNFDSAHYLDVAHILTSVINIVSSPTAVAGNFIVMFSVWKTPSLHTPSNVFICCLAFSDLTVGLLAQPFFVIHKIGEISQRFDMYCTTRILLESLGNVTTGASVLTMCGMAVERCLALFFPLRYNEIVTIKRVLFAVACFWIFFIVLSVLRISLMPPDIYHNIAIGIISMSLLSTYLAYVKILQCVRKHERRIEIAMIEVTRSVSPGVLQMEQKAGNIKNIKRFKKSTVAMIFVLGFFTACFLPFLCVKLAQKVLGYSTTVKTAYLYATTIAFLNSSLNPFVYFWRINSLRDVVKKVVKEKLCKKVVS